LTKQRFPRPIILTLLLTVLGFLVMGYHPGMEDDAIYLAGIKADLNPALFAYNADFFRLQLRLTIFDNWMAQFVRLTHMPLPWAELFWQFACLFVILWAARRVVAQLFPKASDISAQWAGVAMLAAMFTLPVAGTALNIADQHLHPRSVATALIVLAVSRILERKSMQAVPIALLACAFHPLMGAMGLSFCCILSFTLSEPIQHRLRSWRTRRLESIATPVVAVIPPIALAGPFAWLFQPPAPTWLEALHSRHWFRLYQWTWYEWLGAIAPLVLFWLVSRIARKRGEMMLSHFATAIFIYGVFQQAVAMILLGPQSLVLLSALEPMRYLHLVYIFMALVGGAYIGRYVLKISPWRWAVFLVVINAPMFYAQRQSFASTVHLELPGTPPSNSWLQAFDWIKHNTPTNAYFALDPDYLAADGEDYHGFRALAERSSLADNIKDTSVVTKVPQLGPAWKDQTLAQAGWPNFQLADFERLKSRFGVDWVLVSYPQSTPLDCHWHNTTLAVCQIP
jgi:hypothetical protein